MVSLSGIELGDTYLDPACVSKYDEDDMTPVMGMRWYALNITDLLDTLDRIDGWAGQDVAGETYSTPVSAPVSLILNIVRATIVQHARQTLAGMDERLQFDRQWDKEQPERQQQQAAPDEAPGDVVG
jgi:hypothetical protein